ncbi:MAG: ABC transporter permease [Anaerolineae bacterium]|jgi:peptide/nickel transport system permease protein|nr:ABC transporter permease [Anaerolineae bacterium]MBT7075939.1 ABC transporter permease [Anaerolineae bacterium]MBT7782521.1 ABC transporter permease [Anaerolineae bacterium]
MLTYIIRRLFILPLILIGVTMLVFAMLSMLTPYERASLYVSDIPKRQGAIEDIVKKYGLDDPIHIQYWRWMVGQKDEVTGEIDGGILRGDMGFSTVGHMPVAEVIKHRLPATAELALLSAIPLIGLSVWMGIKSAVHHNKLPDQILRVLAIIGWSVPTFVLGLLLLMFFYAKLDWFPPERLSLWASQIVQSGEFTRYTQMNTIDSLLNLRFDIFLDALRHLVLPVITLSIISWAFLLRVTRSSMLDTLRQDYMTTARAKGLNERRVIKGHAVPNALIPVITVGGMTLIGLFNGVVITETIFNYPGLGKFMAASAAMLDVVSVLGMTLFSSFVLVFGNLIVDVLYGIVDPRIRLD